jgi:hypothetical protein
MTVLSLERNFAGLREFGKLARQASSVPRERDPILSGQDAKGL